MVVDEGLLEIRFDQDPEPVFQVDEVRCVGAACFDRAAEHPPDERIHPICHKGDPGLAPTAAE